MLSYTLKPGQQSKPKHLAFASCPCWQMSDDVKGKRDKGHLTSTTPRYKTTLTNVPVPPFTCSRKSRTNSARTVGEHLMVGTTSSSGHAKLKCQHDRITCLRCQTQIQHQKRHTAHCTWLLQGLVTCEQSLSSIQPVYKLGAVQGTTALMESSTAVSKCMINARHRTALRTFLLQVTDCAVRSNDRLGH